MPDIREEVTCTRRGWRTALSLITVPRCPPIDAARTRITQCLGDTGDEDDPLTIGFPPAEYAALGDSLGAPDDWFDLPTQVEPHLPFVARLRFGSESDRRENYNEESPYDEFAFATRAELAAFLQGANAAVGWTEYETHWEEETTPEGG